MALKFNESKGSAIKNSIDAFQFKDGDNSVRVVGDILARYVYWVKGENDKNIPVECLAFNRDEERFDNKEKDWVKVFYPDLNCQWSYVTQCVEDGKIKVVNLKKKLWEQIVTAAEDLGDPTDPKTGWDIKFVKKKTGPHVFNVEYTLQVMKCSKAVRPLTEAELALVAEMKSIDEVMVRPTPEQQKEFMERLNKEDEPEETDVENIEEEFNVSE
jgi:hypothetical protein